MLPQPPELAAVLRRGCFSLDEYERSSCSHVDTDDYYEGSGAPNRGLIGMDCQNGRLFFALCRSDTYPCGVHIPLHPTRSVATIPEVPGPAEPDKKVVGLKVFSREIGDDGVSYFLFSFQCNEEGEATAYFYALQDGAWQVSSKAELWMPEWLQSMQDWITLLTGDDKIYLVATVKYILVFHSTSSSFSTINFPDEMVFDRAEIVLAKGNDSGLYLVHLKGLKISIWLHRDVNGSTGNWLLLDSIFLWDMCADLQMSDFDEAEDGSTTVLFHLSVVGDNAEFVFLITEKLVFYLDVRSRTLRKVYEMSDEGENVGWIYPFMMIWPPTFPTVDE